MKFGGRSYANEQLSLSPVGFPGIVRPSLVKHDAEVVAKLASLDTLSFAPGAHRTNHPSLIQHSSTFAGAELDVSYQHVGLNRRKDG